MIPRAFAVLFWTLVSTALAPAQREAPPMRDMARMGSAYAAKRIGSAVFLQGRSVESVLSQEFATDTELDRMLRPLIKAEVDEEAGVVTAWVLGHKAEALHRPGYGVTLVHGRELEEMRERLPAPLEAPDLSGQPWPMGDVVSSKDPDGLDRAALDAAVDLAFREPGRGAPIRTRAFLVVHRGQLVAERYAEGFGPETRLEGWSMTKSVLNALVGLQVGRGRLRTDSALVLTEWSGDGDPRRAIRIEHLLSMTPGLAWTESYSRVTADPARMLFEAPSAGGFAAARSLAGQPGERMAYSSGTSNVLGLVLRRSFRSDKEFWLFPYRELFHRIGMTSAVMELDPSDGLVPSSLMWATARDWARFGLLFLQDGIWNGTRILPEGWVTQSTRPLDAENGAGYGWHWWLERPDQANGVPEGVFGASGFEGQNIMVLPSHSLVIVRLGCTKGRGYGRIPLLKAVLAAVAGER